MELVVLLPCLVLLLAALAQACLFAPPGPAVRTALPAVLARGVRVGVRGDGAVAVTLVVPRLPPVPSLTVGAAER